MNRIYFSRLLTIALLFTLIACQLKAQSAPTSTLKPGDRIDGMMLTTGATEAPPLWAFCSSQDNDYVKISDCQIPPTASKVAIGHVFVIANEKLIKSDWSEFKWTLSVDGQSIDLEAFGVYRFVLPTMPDSPYPIREVFINVTAWDVVLMDLIPGTHVLRGTAQSESETYSWVANIVIEVPKIQTIGDEHESNRAF